MSFQDLGLSSELLNAIKDLGHHTATPIQHKAIPIILDKNKVDVIALAQTGTGKTAAFTLPMLQLLHANHDLTKSTRQPRGLILAPTRELCAQIGESIKDYGRHLSLRAETIYGGVNINSQIRKLQRGADIIVATPGRLLDLVNQRVINLSKIEILVLDEADRMLDMGFINDIKKILTFLPKQRQNLLFSATFNAAIQSLANGILRNHKLIEVANRNITTELVNQVVYPIDKPRKRELLSYLIGFNNWQQVLVFTRTKHNASKLCTQLISDGLTAAAIHGDKSQGARTRALQEFKTGKIRILVATDIAARGIDIDHLPYVINFELPDVAEDYVHRIGRTGRAGKSGNAISLVSADEAHLLSSIEKLTKKTIAKKIIPGYEPDKTLKTEPLNNRSRTTHNTGRQTSPRQRSEQASDRKPGKRPFAAKPATRTAEESKRSNWRSDSRPATRTAEGNKRSNWRSDSRPATRTEEGNKRSNWRSGSKPAVSTAEGNKRSNWRSDSRPATRTEEGNKRSNWRSGSKPAARTEEGNKRSNWRSDSRPAIRTEESKRSNWRSGSKPAARSSEGNKRNSWRSDAKPTARSY
jgi:ATP-dependent RNA helicase RhlE